LAIEIRRLQEEDDTSNFDCGDELLNNYLRRHAWINQRKSCIGVTYVAVDDAAPFAALGYFTLAAASIPRDRLPKSKVRGLPPYDVPLTLLARLAVDRRFAGRGLGTALLSEALRIALQVSEEVGCRYVITDAYRSKAAWYARFGFHPIEGETETETQKMFLDIRTVRAAI
jgi:GNAT superfamily N-acetyltransferase